ncbi:MAG: polysaccharide deacetylase family protein [Bradyrhizobium sp.]
MLMNASGLMGVRASQWTGLCLGLWICIGAQAASAADCPGHPDALGTSRTLVVDPREHSRIGAMQYGETLPLADHEVVLTFDDGPLPAHSNRILEILAAQCVKATFFTIGRMASAFPEGVRKLRDAGHTIGTHTQSHPLYMKKMPIEQARPEIDDGIASITAALGDSAPAPFFRIPGLSRAEGVEDYVASKGIQTWSADFLADDWRHVSSTRVFELAIKRLEARGRGILLLHDIQGRTVAALPRILREMKSRGYRIVHVIAATPEQPATPTEPQQWQLHPGSETVAASHWPTVPNFVFSRAGTLPAPALSDLDWQPPHAATRGASSREASWPEHQSLPENSAAIALPVPASSVFEIREKRGTAAQEYIPFPVNTERPMIRSHETVGMAKAASADATGPRHAIPGSRPIIPSRLGAAPVETR